MKFKYFVNLLVLSLYVSLLWSAFGLFLFYVDIGVTDETNFGFIGFIGFIFSFLTLLSHFLMFVWMYLVSNYAHNLGHAEMKYRPISILFYWFIPILNFYKPFKVMKEIWSVSLDSDETESEKIKLWFLGYILTVAGTLLLVVTTRIDDNFTSMDEWQFVATVSFSFFLLWIFLTIKFVKSLSNHQISKWHI